MIIRNNDKFNWLGGEKFTVQPNVFSLCFFVINCSTENLFCFATQKFEYYEWVVVVGFEGGKFTVM